MNQRSSTPVWKPSSLLLLAVLIVGAGLRVPTFLHPLLSDDEAIYAATALAMQRGDRLYAEVVDHKPPLIYYVYKAGFQIFGPYNMHGAHAFVVLAVLLVGLCLWRTVSLAGHAATALVAALLWLVFSTTWHDYDALAANCELFLLAPQTAAFLLSVAMVVRWRGPGAFLASSFAIGVLTGLSGLFKYQGFTFLAVSGGLTVWLWLERRLTLATACAGLALQIIGSATPVVVYLLLVRIEGSYEANLYWFRFNFRYLDAGRTGLEAAAQGLKRLAMIGGVALVPYALGLAGGVSVAWQHAKALVRLTKDRAAGLRGNALDLAALLWLASSTIAVCAGGRFFGHYFHLVLPALCVLAAPRVVSLWRRGRAWRAALGILVAVPALAFLLLASVFREQALAADSPEPPFAEVAARINALTSPTESFVVWGNSPQLYVLAQRPMGSRFSFCNYMTGESPGTRTRTGQVNADVNVLWDSWDMLFADLDTRRPALLVDTALPQWNRYDKYPIARYPKLKRYVDDHYRLVESLNGVRFYRRR